EGRRPVAEIELEVLERLDRLDEDSPPRLLIRPRDLRALEHGPRPLERHLGDLRASLLAGLVRSQLAEAVLVVSFQAGVEVEGLKPELLPPPGVILEAQGCAR